MTHDDDTVKSCLNCEYLSEHGDKCKWHVCEYTTFVPVAWTKVIKAFIDTTDPFIKCPTWEERRDGMTMKSSNCGCNPVDRDGITKEEYYEQTIGN